MAHATVKSPGAPPRVAAHLIVGAREEPFLSALLASLEDVCATLIVNDNAPSPSPHSAVFHESRFGREGRLIVDRTPFTDFSAARNICVQLHHENDAGEWAAFIDADEVHGAPATRIAARLDRVPYGVDRVEGYTWHFFQSFDWYMSIERRLSFFRCTPAVRWEGAVHERLQGLSEGRLVLPYVYAHYGWVFHPQRMAQKGHQYSALGAPGETVPQDQIEALAIDNFFEFAGRWKHVLRFTGSHPAAARSAIARLRIERAADFELAEQLIRRHQRPRDRLLNALLKLNYEQRWRARALHPLARRLLW